MKTIFVPILGTQSDHHSLITAKTLAALLAAKIDCVHVRLDIDSALALATRETTWRIEREENESYVKARGEFDRIFDTELADDTVIARGEATWRDIVGYPTDEYTYHGRMRDVVVVAREKLFPEYCAEMVTSVGRPVIIACAKPQTTIGETVLVAWNNSAESAKALTAAMPILHKAKTVILAASPDPDMDEGTTRQSLDELRQTLRPHGIGAEVHLVADSREVEADALKEFAYEMNCDLVVMGAYGHSRLREFVFGGVTREFLKECAIPVLMSH